MTENILKKYKNNKFSVLEEEEDKEPEIITFDDMLYYFGYNISKLEKDIKNININNKTNDNSLNLGKRKNDNQISHKHKYLGCGIFD